MEKKFNFMNHGLKVHYLKLFRSEANSRFKVWKKDNGYFVAVNAMNVNGMNLAEETIPFGEDNIGARKKCDELRMEFILSKVKESRKYKTIY